MCRIKELSWIFGKIQAKTDFPTQETKGTAHYENLKGKSVFIWSLSWRIKFTFMSGSTSSTTALQEPKMQTVIRPIRQPRGPEPGKDFESRKNLADAVSQLSITAWTIAIFVNVERVSAHV